MSQENQPIIKDILQSSTKKLIKLLEIEDAWYKWDAILELMRRSLKLADDDAKNWLIDNFNEHSNMFKAWFRQIRKKGKKS